MRWIAEVCWLVIAIVDGVMLTGAWIVREWVIECTGLRLRWIETALIFGWGVGWSWLMIASHWYWALIVVPFAVTNMVRLMLQPDSARERRFWSPRAAAWRCWGLALLLLSAMPPWRMALPPLATWLSLVLFECSIALPSNARPGRRAKLAKDKVIALFGTGWVERPLGVSRVVGA